MGHIYEKTCKIYVKYLLKLLLKFFKFYVLLRHIQEVSNTQKSTSHSGQAGLTSKISVLPKLIYRFNTIPREKLSTSFGIR